MKFPSRDDGEDVAVFQIRQQLKVSGLLRQETECDLFLGKRHK